MLRLLIGKWDIGEGPSSMYLWRMCIDTRGGDMPMTSRPCSVTLVRCVEAG